MPRKILIADDEPTVVALARQKLEEHGYAVETARNGRDAWNIIKTVPIDLIVLDVIMPIMDGIETLRALKALNPDCVVVMLTSLANRQTIDDAAALGAANYIRKDAPPEDIGRALSDTIDSCFEFDDSEAGTPPPET